MEIEYGQIVDIAGRFVVILVILVVTVIVARCTSRAMNKLINLLTPSQNGIIDTTHYFFLRHVITAFIYLIGISCAVTLIPPLKSVTISLLASSGVLAIIVGFASQQTLSNFISGFFIDMFRPFEIGDYIKVGDKYEGSVSDMSLRHTVLKTDENNLVIIPNARIISEIIENKTLTDLKTRACLDIFLDYQADLETAMAKVIEIMDADLRIVDLTPKKVETLAKEQPTIHKVEIKVNSLNPCNIHIKCWYWAASMADAAEIAADSYRRIKYAFDKNRIPFSQCMHNHLGNPQSYLHQVQQKEFKL